MIGGRRDVGGCEGGHVSVRKGTRIDGTWVIRLKDAETVSRGQSEGRETGGTEARRDAGENKGCGRYEDEDEDEFAGTWRSPSRL